MAYSPSISWHTECMAAEDHIILLVCLKERMLLSLADLITMATLLSVTPSIKDAFSASARAEKRGSCFTFPC